MRLNSAGVVLDVGLTSSGWLSISAILSSGRSSECTTANRRSLAPTSVAWADTDSCLRAGVTIVIVSSTASKIRISVGRTRQVFNQANDVVTKIAEHAGRHRRQAVRKGDAAFDKEASQRNERRVVESREGPGLGLRNAIDLRPATIDAKYDIRLQADNRVAPTDRTVFD